MRLALEVTKAVREVWPERLPLFFRVSATDWAEGGWDLAQTIELSRAAEGAGRRSDRCFERRRGAACQNSGRAWLPSGICGSDSARSRNRDRRGGHDHRPSAGRHHPRPPVKPIWFFWRANCCAIRIGRGVRPRNWARRSKLRCSTSARGERIGRKWSTALLEISRTAKV